MKNILKINLFFFILGIGILHAAQAPTKAPANVKQPVVKNKKQAASLPKYVGLPTIDGSLSYQKMMEITEEAPPEFVAILQARENAKRHAHEKAISGAQELKVAVEKQHLSDLTLFFLHLDFGSKEIQAADYAELINYALRNNLNLSAIFLACDGYKRFKKEFKKNSELLRQVQALDFDRDLAICLTMAVHNQLDVTAHWLIKQILAHKLSRKHLNFYITKIRKSWPIEKSLPFLMELSATLAKLKKKNGPVWVQRLIQECPVIKFYDKEAMGL